MCDNHDPRGSPQRGFTLIELLVSLLVALLIGLAAAAGAMLFSAYQRQGVGAGVATLSTTNSLMAIQQDVSEAGLGFFGDSAFLCEKLNLSIGTTDLSSSAFSPLKVVHGTAFDQIDVVYASEVVAGANVALDTSSNGSSAQLHSYLPVSAGQAVLLAPAPPTPPAISVTGGTCTVRSVSAVATPASPAPEILTFASAAASQTPHNQVSFAQPVTYAANDRASVLGTLAWNRYRVDAGGNLWMDRVLKGDSAIVLRNVVGFRVRYGVAAVGATSVSAWTDAVDDATGQWATLPPAALARVRAVRIGIVTSSTQPEKADASGKCSASTSLPKLFDADVSLPPGWECYRYRSAEATVPLRNLILGLR
jgi:type IV pilus assembly protein PilW